MSGISSNPYQASNSSAPPTVGGCWSRWFPHGIGTRFGQLMAMGILVVSGFFFGPYLLVLEINLLSFACSPTTVVRSGSWQDGFQELFHLILLPSIFLATPAVAGVVRVRRCWIVCLAGIPVGFYLYQCWNFQANGYGAIGLWYAAKESLLPVVSLLLGIVAGSFISERAIPRFRRWDFVLIATIVFVVALAVVTGSRDAVFGF